MSHIRKHSVDGYRFGIDAFEPNNIAGWIYRLKDDAPVELSLSVNGKRVGTFRADFFRRDLENMRSDASFAFYLSPFDGDWRPLTAAGATVSLAISETEEPIAEVTWDGCREPGAQGIVDSSGEELRINKSKFVVPISGRTQAWRRDLLTSSKTLIDVSRASGHMLCAAYGTLLGAVREGAMIPHDDDVDLMFVSSASSMLSAVKEFHRYQEYLRERGYTVVELSNGQMHVTMGDGPSVDVFLSWVDSSGSLILTFTVKEGVPARAVFPFGEVTLDGYSLPAPAQPEVLLEAIYGPHWKVPDPSFNWKRSESVTSYFAPLHNYSRGANNEYWNVYYSGKGGVAPPDRPSQFALFALSVRDAPAFVVDLGCGSGRDSLYMGLNGIRTLGVDYSQSAIDANTGKASALGLDRNVSFRRTDVSDLDQVRQLLDDVNEIRGDGPLCVYSRFFFHAIDESTQGAALLLVKELLGREGDYCAFEFRTDKDKDREKVTPSHYRRYVNPDRFIADAREIYGLECNYRVEGTGYAVFKSDDAHVVRLVLTRK